MGKPIKREKGRIKHLEKSWVHNPGDIEMTVPCLHGWYTARDKCVKCSKPKAECELELFGPIEARDPRIER